MSTEKQSNTNLKWDKIALTGFEDISFEQTMTFSPKLVHLRA